MLKKPIINLFFGVNCFLFTVGGVLASEDFYTTFSTVYDISDDGIATVTQNIQLTNQQSNIYATEYALDIGSTRISQVLAFDKSGNPIDHSLTTVDNKTIIVTKFDRKVVGKGQTLDFTIRYQNEDASQKTGQVLEINIPKLNPQSQIDQYQVTINIPLVFGQPKIVTPADYQLTQTATATSLTFDSNHIVDQGITAIFGQMQVFDLHLTYNLENPSVSNVVTQIALPPDTPYQKMYYHTFTKAPQVVEPDADGNWIATYQLDPKEKISVVVTASAIVYLDPLVSIPPPDLDNLKTYTKAQKYWEISHDQIQAIAQKYQTPEAIYNYLVSDYTYNYDRINSGIGRLGAINATAHPDNAICTEFTDVFIALARANQIPAREINGYAYTQNAILKPLSLLQDVLHSWPEYFDSAQNRWIPVDPTWGNTTGGVDYFNHLDFNHIVFAIHGTSSDRPYPAGYYKFQNSDSKDLSITFSENSPEIIEDYEVTFTESPFSLFSSEQAVDVQIMNLSNHALYNVPVTIQTDQANLLSAPKINLTALLPFATAKLTIRLKPVGTPTALSLTIADRYENTYDLKNVQNYHQIFRFGTYAVLGIVGLFLAFISGRLLVQRFVG